MARLHKHLQILVTPETYDRIDSMAREQGVSRASVVRDLIEKGLRSQS